MTSEKSNVGWYFLGIVLFIYAIAFILKREIFLKAIYYVASIFSKIIPIFLLVFVLLVIINRFIKPQSLAKHLGEESGIKGWIIAIIAGIISTGPIYLWYPLLNELQKHGVRNGIIATFLYNRAVKPALIPLMIYYFGLKFTIVLTFFMILASLAQGMIIEKLVGVKS
ncbi:MAG: hypothetical protein J7K22_03335 [Nanoarchaeota archaeon]|nr:hypothetical protein [Nanoarchaeota archaeon]